MEGPPEKTGDGTEASSGSGGSRAFETGDAYA